MFPGFFSTNPGDVYETTGHEIVVHGTSLTVDKLKSIAEHGLDASKRSYGKVLGVGCYTTTKIPKAMTYAGDRGILMTFKVKAGLMLLGIDRDDLRQWWNFYDGALAMKGAFGSDPELVLSSGKSLELVGVTFMDMSYAASLGLYATTEYPFYVHWMEAPPVPGDDVEELGLDCAPYSGNGAGKRAASPPVHAAKQARVSNAVALRVAVPAAAPAAVAAAVKTNADAVSAHIAAGQAYADALRAHVAAVKRHPVVVAFQVIKQTLGSMDYSDKNVTSFPAAPHGHCAFGVAPCKRSNTGSDRDWDANKRAYPPPMSPALAAYLTQTGITHETLWFLSDHGVDTMPKVNDRNGRTTHKMLLDMQKNSMLTRGNALLTDVQFHLITIVRKHHLQVQARNAPVAPLRNP